MPTEPFSSSDIISHTSVSTLKNGKPAELVHFRDGKVLQISANGLAFYQSEAGINDEFNKGLLSTCTINTKDQLKPGDNARFIKEYKAGYIGLQDDKALLITPVAIQLFHNKTDALHNRHEICRLDLL